MEIDRVENEIRYRSVCRGTGFQRLDRSFRLRKGYHEATGKEPSMHKNVVTQIRKSTRKKVFRRKEDPDRPGGPSRRDPNFGAVPPGMDRPYDVLLVVQGVSGCGKERAHAEDEAGRHDREGPCTEGGASLKKALAESVLETMKYKKVSGCRTAAVRPDERGQETGDYADR